MFNLANELEGTGLLGLPYTFRLGGWASAACMVLCGTMAGFTGYCIAMCMYDEKGVRVRATYRSVGLACFGRAGERTVFLMQMTNLVCVGVVFLVLIGSTLHSAHQLIGDESGSGDGASGSASILGLTISRADRRLWTALATCAALPTVHIGGFRKLAYLSMAGTLLLLVIVVLGVALSAKRIGDDGLQAMPPTELKHVPAAFSIYVFAFSCHGIIPELESSMARPSDFKKVVGGVFLVNMLTKARCDEPVDVPKRMQLWTRPSDAARAATHDGAARHDATLDPAQAVSRSTHCGACSDSARVLGSPLPSSDCISPSSAHPFRLLHPVTRPSSDCSPSSPSACSPKPSYPPILTTRRAW